jgi:hypothetical protein
MVAHILMRGNMFKLSGFSVQAALAAAVMLAGAGNASAQIFPVLTSNTVSSDGLTGAQAAGQSALESLNGVAVEAVVLPPEAGR